jgi:signal transduction histidine kinase
VVVEQEDPDRHRGILHVAVASGALGDFAGPRSLRQLLDAVLTIGGDFDLAAMLDRIIQSAVDLVDARYGALGVLDASGTRLAQFITVGLDDEQRARIGDLPEGHGILGLLIVDAEPLRLPDLNEHPDSFGFPPGHPPMRSFLGVPIRVRDQVFGNLYLTDKMTGEVFTDVDEELVVGLAAAAGVAIENARLHSRVHELGLLEDRERIARDLHDTVIQRLFATGLSLQGSIRLIRTDPDQAAERVERAIDDLDLTSKHIRSAIFDLESSRPASAGLRSDILACVRDASAGLTFEPRVLFDGPVDSAVDDALAADVVAVVREALSNVVKHAGASRVDVSVSVGDALEVHVADDGVGPAAEVVGGHGIANLGTRAARWGGTSVLVARDPAGSDLRWRVPLP